MGKRGVNPSGRSKPASAPEVPPEDHLLVVTFNDLRDELISTLVYILGNRDDAMDAAQEAFLKCWRARATIGEVQNLRAWVFRVAMNTARDLQRSAWSRRVKPLVGEELMLPGRDESPETSIEDQETLDLLRKALADLRPEEKEVFLLRQNGNLTYEQISEIRNAPVGTVKTQMRSALIKLRRVLNPHDSTEAES